MDLDQLKHILTLVQEHGVTELEIEQDGLRVKVRKDAPPAGPAASPYHTAPAAGTSSAGAPPLTTPMTLALSGLSSDDETDVELAVVKSPIVGTFYRSPEPGAASFVEIGATVKKGQVLCIIEEMKLMNEIDSEYDGEVVNAYVENGQPVQYGERLFAIRTK